MTWFSFPLFKIWWSKLAKLLYPKVSSRIKLLLVFLCLFRMDCFLNAVYIYTYLINNKTKKNINKIKMINVNSDSVQVKERHAFNMLNFID